MAKGVETAREPKGTEGKERKGKERVKRQERGMIFSGGNVRHWI